MTKVDEIKPVQEMTSTYFNSIIRRDINTYSVEDLPLEVIANFNHQIRLAFTDDAEDAISRVRYLIPYILQSIDWDQYSLPLEAWQLRYYYQRDRFLAKTRLSYSDFINHKPLQKAVSDLGLQPEPTFEFILFLK